MLFDAHFHFDGELCLDDSLVYFKKFFDEYSIDKAAVLAYCTWTEETDCPISNFKAAWLKKQMPDKIFAYMSFRHDLENPFTSDDYYNQLCDTMRMGFDGVKFLEGKPDVRKRLGMSLADRRYDKVFEKLEKDGTPIVYHVADPLKYWLDPNCYGYYGDGTFLTKDELYAEVDDFMQRFPKLRISFAHFYFLGEELERASEFFDKYENACFDLAPGREMFHELANDIPAARDFFKKYKTHLIWGSDINNTLKHDDYNRDVYKLYNNVFGNGEKFFAVDADFTPLGIDEDTMEYVRYKNQLAISGETPAPLNEDAVREEIVKFSKLGLDLCEKDKRDFAQIARDFGVEL